MTTPIKQRHLLLIFIAMGFSAMISQVVLLRELVLFFTGNELTLGIILALWLLWTAFGSGIVGRLIKFSAHPENLLITCQFLLVILLPLTVVFIRITKALFSIPIGEMANPIFILLVPLIALAPICIIIGFLYTLGCKLLYQIQQEGDSTIPGRVYLFEAIGSGIAGFIASIFLFRFLENFQIVTIVCILNLSVALLILFIIRKNLFLLFISLLAILITMMIMFFPRLDGFANRKMWGMFELLHSETTIYGNIAVTRLGESVSFYENGVIMFTHPDLMAAEESVHFALLEHPDPRSVLLIGGNAAASLQQVLFHPHIESVDLVLLDPASIRLAQTFLGSETEILKDKRIKTWYQDGRMFIRHSIKKYDVVVVNLPDPQTALINRYYTTEFYQSIKRLMNENGILAFSMSSSENVLSDEQNVLLTCLYRTMAKSFADIVLIPGNSIHFIGCVSANILTKDPSVLVNRLHQRNLPTVYMREYYIPFRMTPDRMSYITEKVTTYPVKIINRDFRPIGYFYNIILWLTYFKINLKVVLHFLSQTNVVMLLILLVLIISPIPGWAYFSAKKKGSISPIILLTIMTVGLSAISLEVLIILAFQAIYGYAYYQLALIMSGFMIGLTLGSWLSLKSLKAMKASFGNFIVFQIILTAYPLITAAVLLVLSQFMLSAFLIQAIFLLVIVGTGLIGGYQFPLASHLLFNSHYRIERLGGMLYASDLAGSVIGALITSTLLIPIFGLGLTCVMFSILNCSVLLILFLNYKKG